MAAGCTTGKPYPAARRLAVAFPRQSMLPLQGAETSPHRDRQNRAPSPCIPASRRFGMAWLLVKESMLTFRGLIRQGENHLKIGVSGDELVFVNGQPATGMLASVLPQPRALTVEGPRSRIRSGQRAGG